MNLFAPSKRISDSKSAFTLMELILVMVILATVMALAAPKLTGWGKGAKLRDSADEFLAAARWSRMQAVSTGNIHAIVIDPGGASFSVRMIHSQGQVAVDGPFRNSVPMPEGGRIEVTDASNTPIDTIQCYPTNRVDAARVKLTDRDGQIMVIQCLSPAEEFALVGQEGR